MIDTREVTQRLASFLAPLLPYLTESDDEAGRKLDAVDREKANAMWIRLRPKFEARESAMEAAHDACQSPQDIDALAAFRLQLKKLLAEDTALAEDLVRLLDAPRPETEQTERSGDRDIAVGNNKWIITGNWNIVNSRDNDK